MSVDSIYFITGAILFGMGFIALVIRTNLLHRLLAVNIMGVGVFMWFIAGAYQHGATDSVPHALVLTGIVVAVSATAFALALLLKIHLAENKERPS